MASVPALTSYSNALVLLASPRINSALDTLRRAHDKSHPRWPAHITLLFPFCADEDLPTASRLLHDALAASDGQPAVEPFEVCLGQVGRFSQDTIYLAPSAGGQQVKALWKRLSTALNYSGRDFVPHMTLGQGLRQKEQVEFLTRKGEKLVEQDLRWIIDRVCILRKNESLGGKMEVLEEIPLGGVVPAGEVVSSNSVLTTEATHYFNGQEWTRHDHPSAPVHDMDTFTVATYNVLHDDAHPSTSRLQPVVRAILQGNADIVCLQEITDEFLPLVLQHPDVLAKYPWSNRAPNTVLESDRNIVILARAALPFNWRRVNLSPSTKHKAACIASIRFHSRPSLVIASVHLTAGLAPEHITKKSLEIAALLAYLQSHHPNDQWIIAGDTNWPDSEPFPHPEQLLDVWSGGLGATYDPSANSLADSTAREDRSPQRYDRILVGRKGSILRVISTSLFGTPENGHDPPSDHWGLMAVFGFGPPTNEIVTSSERPADVVPALPAASGSDSDLEAVAQSEGWLPSQTQSQQMQVAVDSLRALLAGPATTPRATEDQDPSDSSVAPSPPSSSVVKLFVVPVGGYALGVHTLHSDLDCLVVGNINPHTFWAVAKSRIRTWSKTNANGVEVKLRRFVKDAAVQMMELSVGGIEVDMQYSLAPKLVERWNELPDLPSDSPEFLLPITSLKSLNAHRDALALSRVIQPSMDSFRLAHRSIKLFCSRRGLVGSRFGYLGGFHITLLLSRIVLHFPVLERSSLTGSQLVSAFFHEYSRFNWEETIVSVDLPDSSTPLTYRRTANREPMVILSIQKPAINVTAHASKHSMMTISREFAKADAKLATGVSWADVVGTKDAGVRDFLDDFKMFVKVEVSYWGSSCTKGRALEGWLESRFISLLVQLNAQLPDIHAQLWPARFTDASMADEESRDIHGFYLIGLSPLKSSSVPEDEQQKAAKNAQTRAAILNVLRSFEEFTHNNQRYYDQGEMFVALSDVRRSALGSSVVLDNHQWADGGFDDEDADETNAGDSDDTEEDDTVPSEDAAFMSSASRKRKIKEGKSKTGYVPAPSKLRTSVDVLNRLSWDPMVVKEDYVIGYEDRFKGIREMPLASWKREVEDEAFIPFHRVVYFKRKSDETLVWDRKTKTDLIFGSGAGPG